MPTKKKMSKRDKKFWADQALAEAQRKELNDSPTAIHFCPFCDSLPGEAGPEVMGTHPGTDWVECNYCGAQGPSQVGRIKVKDAAMRAVAAWNAARR